VTSEVKAGGAGEPAQRISLLVSDVDGTLVTQDKILTPGTVAAARRLRNAGVAFAIVSSRPPRGMRALVEPLALDIFGGFNGSTVMRPDFTPIEQHFVPEEAAHRAVEAIVATGADVWVFDDRDWFVTNPAGHYVPLETRTVQFEPSVVPNFDGHLGRVGKIVGSSTDFDRLGRTEAEVQLLLGREANAHRSQLYYLDVTSPMADKGHAVRAFARHFDVPLGEVAVVGDMANDLPMFAVAGLKIAMGNALPPIQQQADFVTTSNEEDGVAQAIEDIILPRAKRLPR
jgi:Cof subfamily protein (haloacid dehalogenase superfamily)